MKHNLKITILLIVMFLLTQFIGLYVVNHYATEKVVDGQVVKVDSPALPYGMESPDIEGPQEYNQIFLSILVAFVIAISLLFLFIRFKIDFILKLWFFVVVTIALGIFINSVLPEMKYATWIALAIALPFAFMKIYKRNLVVHNLTELFIYPGIAAVFVPILSIWTAVILLVIISIYDAWAVWHSGVMQKMAKYQIDKLNVFSGLFVPYVSKKVRMKLKKMKKSKKKAKKVKANIAVLGGGDIIFPIITAGVALKTFGFLPSILVIAGATLGLAYLFFLAKKKQFYPAMPFISTGIFLGLLVSWLLI